LREDSEFTAFVAGSQTGLRRVAYAWTRDWAQADDAVQSTYERLYKSWHRVDQGNPFPYARTTLIHALISEARRPHRKRELVTSELPDKSSAPGADSRVEILEALAALAPFQRAVIILRYVEDLSVEETAHLLGRSTGHVKRTAFDARRELRKRLGEIPLER
jgi:RNA polymerase sigma-70 factor (sigma-E family)